MRSIGLHKKEDVDDVVTTCVLLHNMILKFDGLDKLWEVRMRLQRFATLPL